MQKVKIKKKKAFFVEKRCLTWRYFKTFPYFSSPHCCHVRSGQVNRHFSPAWFLAWRLRLPRLYTTTSRITEGLPECYRKYQSIHIAAMYGQAKLIDILVQHGSLPDATDFLGCTTLHLASQKGFQNVIVSAVKLSCNVTHYDSE